MFVVRTVLLVVHLGVVFLLLGTRLNEYLPPKWFAGINLLSLVFPFLLFFHFSLTIYWLVSLRKRGLVFLLIGIFLMPMIRRWVNYSSLEKGNPNLKVMSFNIKGTSEKDEKTEFLNGQEVDVLMLQECGFEMSDKMELSNFRYQAHSEVVSIYSKFPIQRKNKIPLSDNGYAIFADIRIKGEIFRFINVYLEPFKLEKDMVKPSMSTEINEIKAKSLLSRLLPVFKVHQTQIEEIREYVNSSPYPVILAGDFNAVPNSYEYYHLGKNLDDVFAKVGRGSATSFHDYKFPLRIDYVFASPGIKALNYKVDRGVNISDHYPIYTDFLIESN